MTTFDSLPLGTHFRREAGGPVLVKTGADHYDSLASAAEPGDRHVLDGATPVLENHLRIITRRAGRRIMDGAGASHARCGGALSSYDLPQRSARPDVLAQWITCAACRATLVK